MAINENGVQVERQYIGARYVPKFFQGVNGSPEWVAGLAYEALTIVTYLGNSFTSKVPVPAGIGNPADNPTYWVNTGNYNAQVDEYRKDVAQVQEDIVSINQSIGLIDNRISTLENKNQRYFIFIGDSYSDNFPPASIGCCQQTAKYLNLTPSQYNVQARGGAGFVVQDADNRYIAHLQRGINAMPANTTLTDVVIEGGLNDGLGTSGTIEELKTAMNFFSSYVKNINPNANIWLAWVGWGVSESATLMKTYEARWEYEKAFEHNMLFLKNVQWIMYLPQYLGDNSQHPNNDGVEAIAKACACCITGGSVDIAEYHGDDISAEYFHNGVIRKVFKTTLETPAGTAPNRATKLKFGEMYYWSGYQQISFSASFLANNEIFNAILSIGYNTQNNDVHALEIQTLDKDSTGNGLSYLSAFEFDSNMLNYR